MSIFDDMLGSNESVFKNNAIALDFDYQPKLLLYRENEQREIAGCIKPLFQSRNGTNLLITGKPGVGKTAACKHVLQELEDETEKIIPIYINCWQKNTSYKIILELCDLVGYKLTQNKKTDELFKVMKSILNKKSVVFVFDEIDKLEDFDFLYMILEEIYKKTVILVTNYKTWVSNLDDRLKSRLMLSQTEFRPYNYAETKGILKYRLDYAFVQGVFDMDAFDHIVKKTDELKDIRAGLHLLKEAGNSAEEKASRKIKLEHAEAAISKLDGFFIKKSDDLDEDIKFILKIIKNNPETKIGELFSLYEKAGGKSAYKTFQRKVKKLEEGDFIFVKKIIGGAEGTTKIVSHKKSDKQLTDFEYLAGQ